MRERKTLVVGVRRLLASRSFQAVTFACALNDVGSWALVSWHATFYTRVFGIGPDIYAPMLAAIIPIGGIIGGVGSGLMGDWLSRTGNRHWLTSGAPPCLQLVCTASQCWQQLTLQKQQCLVFVEDVRYLLVSSWSLHVDVQAQRAATGSGWLTMSCLGCRNLHQKFIVDVKPDSWNRRGACYVSLCLRSRSVRTLFHTVGHVNLLAALCSRSAHTFMQRACIDRSYA